MRSTLACCLLNSMVPILPAAAPLSACCRACLLADSFCLCMQSQIRQHAANSPVVLACHDFAAMLMARMIASKHCSTHALTMQESAWWGSWRQSCCPCWPACRCLPTSCPSPMLCWQRWPAGQSLVLIRHGQHQHVHEVQALRTVMTALLHQRKVAPPKSFLYRLSVQSPSASRLPDLVCASLLSAVVCI